VADELREDVTPILRQLCHDVRVSAATVAMMAEATVSTEGSDRAASFLSGIIEQARYIAELCRAAVFNGDDSVRRRIDETAAGVVAEARRAQGSRRGETEAVEAAVERDAARRVLALAMASLRRKDDDDVTVVRPAAALVISSPTASDAGSDDDALPELALARRMARLHGMSVRIVRQDEGDVIVVVVGGDGAQ